MTRQNHRENAKNEYASCEDFRRVFEEDLYGIYQLAFLLTGNHQKAELCFIAGLDDCFKENRVFRNWARTWAKRVIVRNAIRELQPRSSQSNSPTQFPLILSTKVQLSDRSGDSDERAVSGLGDFERFVFVLCVLERYREHECALLLDCSDAEVREARIEAIVKFSNLRSGGSKQYDGDESRGRAVARKA